MIRNMAMREGVATLASGIKAVPHRTTPDHRGCVLSTALKEMRAPMEWPCIKPNKQQQPLHQLPGRQQTWAPHYTRLHQEEGGAVVELRASLAGVLHKVYEVVHIVLEGLHVCMIALALAMPCLWGG